MGQDGKILHLSIPHARAVNPEAAGLPLGTVMFAAFNLANELVNLGEDIFTNRSFMTRADLDGTGGTLSVWIDDGTPDQPPEESESLFDIVCQGGVYAIYAGANIYDSCTGYQKREDISAEAPDALPRIKTLLIEWAQQSTHHMQNLGGRVEQLVQNKSVTGQLSRVMSERSP